MHSVWPGYEARSQEVAHTVISLFHRPFPALVFDHLQCLVIVRAEPAWGEPAWGEPAWGEPAWGEPVRAAQWCFL